MRAIIMIAAVLVAALVAFPASADEGISYRPGLLELERVVASGEIRTIATIGEIDTPLWADGPEGGDIIVVFPRYFMDFKKPAPIETAVYLEMEGGEIVHLASVPDEAMFLVLRGGCNDIPGDSVALSDVSYPSGWSTLDRIVEVQCP